MDADFRRLPADMERRTDDACDPETYAILGAAMEVHRVLGCGFLEAVYVEALAHELEERRIPYEREKAMPVRYKSRPLAAVYRADFVCFGTIIVEAKALASLGGIEQAQLLNYLKASGLQRGLLVNFGARSLEWKRLILTFRASAPDVDKAN
jgi:GxxExxY protein